MLRRVRHPQKCLLRTRREPRWHAQMNQGVCEVCLRWTVSRWRSPACPKIMELTCCPILPVWGRTRAAPGAYFLPLVQHPSCCLAIRPLQLSGPPWLLPWMSATDLPPCSVLVSVPRFSSSCARPCSPGPATSSFSPPLASRFLMAQGSASYNIDRRTSPCRASPGSLAGFFVASLSGLLGDCRDFLQSFCKAVVSLNRLHGICCVVNLNGQLLARFFRRASGEVPVL